VAAEIRLAVVSLSARSPDGRDADYLEWHGLDHHPEQYAVAGIQHGQRWVSTPACRQARAATDDRFDAADHVMQYLFADPLEPSLDRFFTLGAELGRAGRMPIRLPAVELAGYEPVRRVTAAHALVRPEVLPWRPSRGGYLLVERDAADDGGDDLAAVDGVAGFWRYRGGSFDARLADTSGLHLTVCYVDGDPVETGRRLAGVVDADRTLFAAPFVSVVPWDWTRSLPEWSGRASRPRTPPRPRPWRHADRPAGSGPRSPRGRR
jgi:hypothetical protein